MREVSPSEVLTAIKRSSGGKSAGFDGVSIDLLKLLCGRHDDGQYSSTLICVTMIINIMLKCGKVCKPFKFGRITLVPKYKSDGSFSKDPVKMRPITVLPEIGKIANKILADRIGVILLNNPEILASSQRAFLRDGDTAQCVHAVVDAIEDGIVISAGSLRCSVSVTTRKRHLIVSKNIQ